jgi:prophage maintenance system killer protein
MPCSSTTEQPWIISVNDRRGGGLVYPELEQAVAFHNTLLLRLGEQPTTPVDEARLRSTLDRARQMVDQQRGDIVTIASFLLFGLIKDKGFGDQSTRTGLALTLAFLLRNGVAVMAPEEEIAGVALGIAAGEVYAGMVEMWLRESARPIR